MQIGIILNCNVNPYQANKCKQAEAELCQAQDKFSLLEIDQTDKIDKIDKIDQTNQTVKIDLTNNIDQTFFVYSPK